MKVKNLPKRIYLNISSTEEVVDYNSLSDVTFCNEPVSVEDCDVENVPYVNVSQCWHESPQTPRHPADCLVCVTCFTEDIVATKHLPGVYAKGKWHFESLPYQYSYTVKRWAYLSDLTPNT